MKKLFKAPILLLSAAALLTACSNDSIAGVYGFQMGKETGTHFGLYLKLTDKSIEVEGKKRKKCELSFSMKLREESESFSSLFTMIVELLGDQSGNKITVPGYYYKGSFNKKEDATELKLGIDTSKLEAFIEEFDLSDLDFPTLDPDTIEKIVYTTYSSNTVTMNIPISQEDVLLQLYWYGIDINYTEADGFKITDLPTEQQHNPGTHPTTQDVTTINQTYLSSHQELIDKFDFNITAYRDYYTLAMGLVKR